ncbi:acetoin utilization protein AcuC [Paenibacillus sp. KN14-4R]|uniref:acetoin utilization protein AcuC n=1 Tax=Paenibacillus sp. KN14-4R TaxID=3445773 RepID=UPI003FA0A4B6
MNIRRATSAFIYNEQEIRYKFNDDHPFNPKRLSMTVDLLREAGALDPGSVIPLRVASDDELLRVHHADYVEAVKQLSAAGPNEQWLQSAERYGLDTEDTPFFEDMHEVTAQIVGGSIAAADLVMSGQVEHALHLGGGLHHALHNKGAGFCVYNDASAAIAHLKYRYGARVLYVDTDVHHGDGVQWSFYTDPDVCTFSIHETGKYLFPGTGEVNERGEGVAFGSSINIPVQPYTEDDSWMECFEEVLDRTIKQFRPDIIVSQHGCDAHAFDPLAHVHCSMNIYKRMPELLHRYAHDFCNGRWLALGGGGYDIWRVVPRAWSLLWLVMSDHPLLDQISHNPLLRLPEAWLARYSPESEYPLPTTWLDAVQDWTPMPRRDIITQQNRQVKDLALLYL